MSVLFLVFILTGLLLPMKVYEYLDVNHPDFTEQTVADQVYTVPAVPAIPVQRESVVKGILLALLWCGSAAMDVTKLNSRIVSWSVCCVSVYYYLYQLWITHQMDGKKRIIFLLP